MSPRAGLNDVWSSSMTEAVFDKLSDLKIYANARLHFKTPDKMSISSSDSHKHRIMTMMEFFSSNWCEMDESVRMDITSLRQVVRNCKAFEGDQWQELQFTIGQIRNSLSHR